MPVPGATDPSNVQVNQTDTGIQTAKIKPPPVPPKPDAATRQKLLTAGQVIKNIPTPPPPKPLPAPPVNPNIPAEIKRLEGEIANIRSQPDFSQKTSKEKADLFRPVMTQLIDLQQTQNISKPDLDKISKLKTGLREENISNLLGEVRQLLKEHPLETARIESRLTTIRSSLNQLKKSGLNPDPKLELQLDIVNFEYRFKKIDQIKTKTDIDPTKDVGYKKKR